MSIQKHKQGLTVEQILDKLPGCTETEIEQAIQRVGGAVQETDIPALKRMVEIIRSESSDLDKALGLDSGSEIEVAKPSKKMSKQSKAVAQASHTPQTTSSVDVNTVHASYASKVAEPLKEVAAMNQRLRVGFREAAQHFVDEQQEIVDEFYEAVSQPLDKQVEVNHFLSQVPEELRGYFS